VELLWSRFAPLDQHVQCDELSSETLFQGPTTRHFVQDMPAGYSVEDFVRTW
jgi:hypothetical protein